MNRNPPEVSVLIPTRDRREWVAVAIASALAQQDIELEVIVVDDQSTDDTPEFLRSIDDPRVRTIRHGPHGGVAAARNAAIAVARGTWLAFLDDDDRYLPRWLRTAIEIGEGDEADFVFGSTIVVNADGRKMEIRVPPPPDRLPERLRMGGTITGPSAVIARADFVQRTGGFDPGLSYFADWELWLRFVTAGRGARCEEPLVEYVEHQGSMLMHPELNIPKEFRYLRSKHPELDLEGEYLTRWFARRYRLEGRRLRACRMYLREVVEYRNPGSLLRAFVVLLGERPMRFGKRVREMLLHARIIRVKTPADEEHLSSKRESQSSPS